MSNHEIENPEQLEQMIRNNESQIQGSRDEYSLRTKNNICKKFMHSTCANANCPYLHDLSKASLCISFANTGYCARAELCNFRHKGFASDQHSGVIACKIFQEHGYCPEGEKCPYKHSKVICKNFEKGFCQYGPQCSDLHKEAIPCSNYLLGFCPKGPQCPFAQ